MRTTLRCMTACGLVAVGYILGSAGTMTPSALVAQEDAQAGPSEDAIKKVQAAYAALKAAQDALEQENRYNSVTLGTNSFSVTSGGLDIRNDLETGRGVDPETFAALYAGQAIDEIAQDIDFDDQRRLTYKNKVVKMYSVGRLKALYQERLRYSGQGEENF